MVKVDVNLEIKFFVSSWANWRLYASMSGVTIGLVTLCGIFGTKLHKTTGTYNDFDVKRMIESQRIIIWVIFCLGWGFYLNG